MRGALLSSDRSLFFDEDFFCESPVLRWVPAGSRELRLSEIGEHYGRYRLHLPEAERAMARSLERYGQLSPVVICQRQDRYELIDGFKRLGAARSRVQSTYNPPRV